MDELSGTLFAEGLLGVPVEVLTINKRWVLVHVENLNFDRNFSRFVVKDFVEHYYFMHLEGNMVSALSPIIGSHGIPQPVTGKDLNFYGKTGCFGSKTEKTLIFQIPMEVQV